MNDFNSKEMQHHCNNLNREYNVYSAFRFLLLTAGSLVSVIAQDGSALTTMFIVFYVACLFMEIFHGAFVATRTSVLRILDQSDFNDEVSYIGYRAFKESIGEPF